jgi:hypothetical protein
MEAVRTSEMSVDNHFTQQYIPEDNSEHHTRRRENLKSPVAFVLEVDIFMSYFLAILFTSFTVICNSSSDFALIR